MARLGYPATPVAEEPMALGCQHHAGPRIEYVIKALTDLHTKRKEATWCWKQTGILDLQVYTLISLLWLSGLAPHFRYRGC